MFSFGDIVLPFVGILATGMLIFAAKLFFFDSFPASTGVNSSVSSAPSVPRITSKAEDNNPLFPAAGEASAEEAVGSSDIFEIEKTEKPEELEERGKGADQAVQVNVHVTATPMNSNKSAVIKNNAQVQKTQPVRQKAPEQNNKQVKQVKDNIKNNKPEVHKQAQWRVQVGAYGSKKAADEIIAKLAKEGYTATHFAVSRHHKVWVQAGNTRQDAEAAAKKLKKIGYPGSYVIAPPPQK